MLLTCRCALDPFISSGSVVDGGFQCLDDFRHPGFQPTIVRNPFVWPFMVADVLTDVISVDPIRYLSFKEKTRFTKFL